jgi:hypothetical protein
MTSLICRILPETSLLDDYFPFQDLHIEERVLRNLGFWNKAHVKHTLRCAETYTPEAVWNPNLEWFCQAPHQSWDQKQRH